MGSCSLKTASRFRIWGNTTGQAVSQPSLCLASHFTAHNTHICHFAISKMFSLSTFLFEVRGEAERAEANTETNQNRAESFCSGDVGKTH